ncbi:MULTISPECIES: hypothetical protein [Pseudomonas]|uniref:hypothetical protein n=1 Tax=Pseudomonas TaxID=286 RepID=UPI000714C984|nr:MULTISPECIES: hypothetical protein [Pseudomonas]KRP84217.1 hypothetical protein TX25_29200 [Pseudomonas lactis]
MLERFCHDRQVDLTTLETTGNGENLALVDQKVSSEFEEYHQHNQNENCLTTNSPTEDRHKLSLFDRKEGVELFAETPLRAYDQIGLDEDRLDEERRRLPPPVITVMVDDRIRGVGKLKISTGNHGMGGLEILGESDGAEQNILTLLPS